MSDFFKALPSLSGPQLVVAFVVIILIVLLVGGRHYLAPGSARLAAQQTQRSEAIDVLKWQIERSDAKTEEQEERIKKLEDARVEDLRYDQDYRHALAGLAQSALGHLDLARGILIKVEDTWKEMPAEIGAQIKQVPPGKELVDRHPLPVREKEKTDVT